MKWEKYNFTPEYQDQVLACLIRYPEDFYAFGEIIKPQYLTGSAAAELGFRLLEYRKKYGKFPEFTTLANYVYTKAARTNIDHANECKDYVDKLASLNTSDKDEVLDRCVNFAKERALFDTMKRVLEAKQEGNEIDVVKVFTEAVAVGVNLNELGISYYHNVDEVIHKISAHSYGINTGYAAFDRLWKYGWAPGWLIVLLAPPKRYKTAFAINLAINIVSTQDVDVLYYACEISQELAALRGYMNVTGWTQDDFLEHPERGIVATRQAMKKKLWGNIWFKGFPSKSVTISQIKAHAQRVITYHKLKPKAIVIDYAETVQPDKTDKDAPDWRQQADIYTQARALGAELGCAVIMPDRCNKETVGRQVPSMKSFQGSFEKAGIVDVAIGLCSTDAEYKHDRLRFFVFLNRHGDAYKHYDGKIDPARMQVTVGQEIEYKPEDDEYTKPRHNAAQRTFKRNATLVLKD